MPNTTTCSDSSRHARATDLWREQTCSTAGEGGTTAESVASPSPNYGLEPTASSARSCVAPASGSGSGPAFVRQAKRGVSCGVEVPTGEGLTNHPSRVVRLCRRCQNTARSLRSVPREPWRPPGHAPVPDIWDRLVRALTQTATVVTHRQPTPAPRVGERREGLPGSSGRRHGEPRRALGRPWRVLGPPGARQPLRPPGGGLKTSGESAQRTGL